MTLDHPVRSGLCHGPGCQAKITDKSESRYFCLEGCQARWQAAHAGAEVETPFWSYVSNGWSFGTVRDAVEAEPLDLSLGARHHLTGGEYEVTESEPGRAVLTPVEEPTWRTDADGSRWLETYRSGLEYVEMRDGIDWIHAPLPDCRHACTPQLRARLSGDTVWRCACGSLTLDGDYWMERNSRRKGDDSDPTPIRRSWWKPNTWRRNG